MVINKHQNQKSNSVDMSLHTNSQGLVSKLSFYGWQCKHMTDTMTVRFKVIYVTHLFNHILLYDSTPPTSLQIASCVHWQDLSERYLLVVLWPCIALEQCHWLCVQAPIVTFALQDITNTTKHLKGSQSTIMPKSSYAIRYTNVGKKANILEIFTVTIIRMISILMTQT
jgi:hypothetical protein